MNIHVTMSVSDRSNSEIFDLEDLNVESEEEWDELTNEEKERKIQEAIDSLPHQPFWILDSYL